MAGRVDLSPPVMSFRVDSSPAYGIHGPNPDELALYTGIE